MALQRRVDSHPALSYQPYRTCFLRAAHTPDSALDHKLSDRSHVAAAETVRTALDNTHTAVAMPGNRHPPDKTSEQGWVQLDGWTVGWPAFGRKPVGKGIARGAWDSFRCSRALDLENAEWGNVTDQLKYPLGTVVDLDATAEKGWWIGILAAPRPFLTC